TTQTHPSTGPLPLPIRVSRGFLVIGLSGKIRIQTLPPRRIYRVIAIRAASICRLVTQSASSATSPNSPKATVLPLIARPFLRPRCCLRYLYLLGSNIAAELLMIEPVWAAFASSATRCGLLGQTPLGQDFALVDPHLRADRAVHRPRDRDPVVDVRTQRVKRDLPDLVA